MRFILTFQWVVAYFIGGPSKHFTQRSTKSFFPYNGLNGWSFHLSILRSINTPLHEKAWKKTKNALVETTRIISFIMSIHKNLFGWAPPRKAQTQANIFLHKTHCYNVAFYPIKLICITYKTRHSKPVLAEK